MSFLFPGGPIPLFDKLDQRSATPGHEAGQGLSAEGVEASVERELHRLLNSRSRVNLSDFTEANLTVCDYGIPDYTALSVRSDTDRVQIAAAITYAIQHFEPRLLNAIVTPLGAANGITIALFQIDADLPIANTVRRVRFTLAAETPPIAHASSNVAEALA
jgi:type VI secretion system protein ImpF